VKNEPLEIRVGVSTCLLGENVRYDGGHKHDAYVADLLGSYVTFVPVCPEVEMGLGTPREAIRLVRRDGALRLLGRQSGDDHTDAMARYAIRRLADLEKADLSGYILKRGSPSCGMERVHVRDARGFPLPSGRGLFAEALLQRFPLLPVEEEGRLQDAGLRESFVERIFAFRRLTILFGRRWTTGDLVRFHTVHKLTLLAHEPEAYRSLGRIVAAAKGADRADLAARYQERFMAALAKKATRPRHVNVLQHVAGYFKKVLPPPAKADIAAVIDDFRSGLVPLAVPLALLRHYVKVHGVAYLDGQSYLEPHPKELLLRNHA